jgi:hypothetical protein
MPVMPKIGFFLVLLIFIFYFLFLEDRTGRTSSIAPSTLVSVSACGYKFQDEPSYNGTRALFLITML